MARDDEAEFLAGAEDEADGQWPEVLVVLEAGREGAGAGAEAAEAAFLLGPVVGGGGNEGGLRGGLGGALSCTPGPGCRAGR